MCYNMSHTVVRFRLTETDYQSGEDDGTINSVVSKDMRVANPVIFTLTPLTIDQALAGGVALPVGTPPDDNRFSPNRAKGESICLLNKADFHGKGRLL